MQHIQIGSIYCFKIHEFCKIGITKNSVEYRVKNVETCSPYKIEKIYELPLVRNYKDIEKLIHNKLEKKRVHGEWFQINFDEAVKIINDIAEHNSEYITAKKEAALKMNEFYKTMMEGLT